MDEVRSAARQLASAMMYGSVPEHLIRGLVLAAERSADKAKTPEKEKPCEK